MTKNSKNEADDFLKNNEIIFKKYKPIIRLEKGTFGGVYSTIRITDKSIFAMKVEKKDNKIKTLLEFQN